jgi:hypothetical protein
MTSIADEVREICNEAVAKQAAEKRQREMEYRRKEHERLSRLEQLSREQVEVGFSAIVKLCKDEARKGKESLWLSCAEIKRLSDNLWHVHFHLLFDELRNAGFVVKERSGIDEHPEIIHCTIKWPTKPSQSSKSNQKPLARLSIVRED